ncbi:alanine/ornithine racemase family PLP-dependent enzyme [Anaeroselena agilis]|uniref:Alanine/ornithine racemase family PLP-dependent enzyme n=1 Tax=Anaeroselena agilis TaxID=3063788 RepID=A0ABU3NSS7_9FIRM|nr:alanine/ornithine racemase family PLP-dependent enzyme [Selenomonadales bacterium 4137-cl]
MSPHLEIDLDKITYNTAQVVERCHRQSIEVLGVTKGFGAIPPIVSAFIAGGVDGLADARMENILDLRKNGFNLPITLLRIPRLSNVGNVVRYTDTSVNSEIAVMQALGEAALSLDKIHNVVLMVDLGDLREGVLTQHVLETAKQVATINGVKLVGLGTNMGCFGGVLPATENLGLLVTITRAVEKYLGFKLDIVSGGGTSSLFLLEKEEIPAGITQLRIGEGILLGTDTSHNRIIPWLYQDAFMLHAEIIELKTKPSVPFGNIGRDAFGNLPQFEDTGTRKRAILALGRQDVYIEGLVPLDGKMSILGASSDHLIVDITEADDKIRVGDNIAFKLTYSGLLSASGSKYIKKVFRGGG